MFAAADQLWTNSALRPDPICAAGASAHRAPADGGDVRGGSRQVAPKYEGRLDPAPADYQAKGAIFLPENAAMKRIADANPDLAG